MMQIDGWVKIINWWKMVENPRNYWKLKRISVRKVKAEKWHKKINNLNGHISNLPDVSYILVAPQDHNFYR